MNELPKPYIEQMRALLGDAFSSFISAYALPPVRGLRMNPLRTHADIPEDAAERVPWADNAYYIPTDSDAGARAAHEGGAYYIQEPSAMIPASALRPQPGERVLDLCAAPGGKSTQLAGIMQSGVLVCNEPVPARAQILSRNIERMGIPFALVTCAQPAHLAKHLAGYFDRVLVDAPCSGEGMFRKNPEARAEWTQDTPRLCAQRQRDILQSAAVMLRPGGTLCYSTCTYNTVENEQTIDWFINAHPHFERVDFTLPGLPPSQSGTLRAYMHQVRGEGHFTALLRKTGGDRPQSRSMTWDAPQKAQLEAYRAFCDTASLHAPQASAVFGDTLCAVPEGMPYLPGVKILRAGLHLGQCRGRLFMPDHALSMSAECEHFFALDEQSALCYLHGDSLPAQDAQKGWVVVMHAGCPLGFGKVSDGQLKNHYPKGLRRPFVRAVPPNSIL